MAKVHKVGKGRAKRRYVPAHELRVGDVLTFGKPYPDEAVTATEDLGRNIRLTLDSGRTIHPYFEDNYAVLVKD